MIKNDHWITNTEAPTFNISNGLALISVINRHIRNKSTQRAQTMPRPKCQPKVIQDSDPDVCRICPKCCEFIILLASVVSQSFVQVGRWLQELLINRDPHPLTDHHQKLFASRGSPLAHAYHVWLTSVTVIVSYPANRTTDNHIAPPSSAEYITFLWCTQLVATYADS